MAHPVLHFTSSTVTTTTTTTDDKPSQPTHPSQVIADPLQPTDLLLSWDEPPDPATALPAMMANFDWTDADATLCVICQTTVSRTTSLLWVATDCAAPKHIHLYHAACLNAWWSTSGTRSCPRCTKRTVTRFLVHARLPHDRVAWQLMQAVPQTNTLCASSHAPIPQHSRADMWRAVASSTGLYEALQRARRDRGASNAWLPFGGQAARPAFSACDAMMAWVAILWDKGVDKLSAEGREMCREMQLDEYRVLVRPLERVGREEGNEDALYWAAVWREVFEREGWPLED